MNTQTMTRLLESLAHAQRQVTTMLAAADEAFDAIEDGRSFDLVALRIELNEAHAVASKFLLWSTDMVTAQPEETARPSVHPEGN